MGRGLWLFEVVLLGKLHPPSLRVASAAPMSSLGLQQIIGDLLNQSEITIDIQEAIFLHGSQSFN